MDFVSWSVFGILFILAEFATGTMYLLAIGLACLYPAIADYTGAPSNVQIAVFVTGAVVHSLIVMILRKRKTSSPSSYVPPDVGDRVEVIEWLDDCSARVRYRGEEWQADKLKGEMPDAAYGIIHSIQGSRLIISTEQPGNT